MKKNIHKLYVQYRSFTGETSSIDGMIITNEKKESNDTFTYVDIGECETEFSFIAEDLHSKIAAEKIRTLEQYKKEFMAESQVKINNLDEQIAKIKCLEAK